MAEGCWSVPEFLRSRVSGFKIRSESIRYKGFVRVQPHGDGIRSQAGSEKFRIHGICCLHDLVGLTAKRTPVLFQGTMNQTTEKMSQPLDEARHCLLLIELFQRSRAPLN